MSFRKNDTTGSRLSAVLRAGHAHKLAKGGGETGPYADRFSLPPEIENEPQDIDIDTEVENVLKELMTSTTEVGMPNCLEELVNQARDNHLISNHPSLDAQLSQTPRERDDDESDMDEDEEENEEEDKKQGSSWSTTLKTASNQMNLAFTLTLEHAEYIVLNDAILHPGKGSNSAEEEIRKIFEGTGLLADVVVLGNLTQNRIPDVDVKYVENFVNTFNVGSPYWSDIDQYDYNLYLQQLAQSTGDEKKATDLEIQWRKTRAVEAYLTGYEVSALQNHGNHADVFLVSNHPCLKYPDVKEEDIVKKADEIREEIIDMIQRDLVDADFDAIWGEDSSNDDSNEVFKSFGYREPVPLTQSLQGLNAPTRARHIWMSAIAKACYKPDFWSGLRSTSGGPQGSGAAPLPKNVVCSEIQEQKPHLVKWWSNEVKEKVAMYLANAFTKQNDDLQFVKQWEEKLAFETIKETAYSISDSASREDDKRRSTAFLKAHRQAASFSNSEDWLVMGDLQHTKLEDRLQNGFRFEFLPYWKEQEMRNWKDTMRESVVFQEKLFPWYGFVIEAFLLITTISRVCINEIAQYQKDGHFWHKLTEAYIEGQERSDQAKKRKMLEVSIRRAALT